MGVPQNDSRPDRSGLQVLIVDDSEPSLRLMRFELEKAGYEVVTASNGRQGVSRARETRPDLILLDVLMPEMDGFEACRLLKASPELSSIPVLMWTSLDSTSDIVRGLEAGAQDYVTKPFVPAVLRARIDTALRAKQAHDAVCRSNRELAESEHAIQRALNVRNEFLSHVSHELRTPLTSVHQFLSVVLDGLAGDLEDEQREYLEIAFRNAKQLRSMIGDLMDVTRLQNGKMRIEPRPLALAPLIEDVARAQEAVAESRGIRLGCALSPVSEVLADEVRMRRVLTNLIDNALKFSPEGGEVELQLGRDPEDASLVRVGVRDTGPGVIPEVREHIFRYMQQGQDDDWRSRKGLGIGLYICRELVTRQGGRIWVESGPDKGSVFLFTLPALDLPALIAPALLLDGRPRRACSVLRVDLEPRDEAGVGGLSEALSRRAYHLVKTTLLDCDVLLPRYFGGEEDTCYVVAGTGRDGLDSLRARIESTLKREAGIDEEEIRIRVRGLVLDTRTAGRTEPAEVLGEVASQIHGLTEANANWGE